MAHVFPTAPDPTEPFARYLAAFGASLEESRTVLRPLGAQSSTQVRGAEIVIPADGGPRVVLDGWACQMRPSSGCTQQIIGFVLPGETIGSFWRRPEFDICRLRALTRFKTAPADRLLAHGDHGVPLHPELLQAARRAEDFSRHLFVNQIIRLGARDAYAGIAHLLLELYSRLARVGLADGGCFQVPVGQRILARTMGYSVAHTNHTLQRMSADGLFATKGDVIQLLQRERLERLAGVD